MRTEKLESDALGTAGASCVDVMTVRDRVITNGAEWVADEVPIALQVNGVAHSVMMATPADLDDFALGFLLSEGLIDTRADLLDVEESRSTEGVTLALQITHRCLYRFKERRRSMAGRTGCGVCGTESLEQVIRPLSRPVAAVRVDAAALRAAMAGLAERQQLQRLTGATHAAAWCGLEGDVRWIREDVGRHNALDKLIGALATVSDRSAADAAAGFIVVTSRASFEMVHKTANAGVGLLVAISAATRLAVELADRSGVALVGFARGTGAVVYSHADRIRFPATDPAGQEERWRSSTPTG